MSLSRSLPHTGPGGPPDTPFFCHTCNRTFVDANALRMHCRSSKAHAAVVIVPAGTPTSKPKSTPKGLKSIPTSNSGPIKKVTIITSTSSNADPRPKPQCKRCNRVFKSEDALSNHERSRGHKNMNKASNASLATGLGSKKAESTDESAKKKLRRKRKKKGPNSTTASTGDAGDGRAKPTTRAMSTSTSSATIRPSTVTPAPSAYPEDDDRKIEIVPPTLVPAPARAPVPVPVGNPEGGVLLGSRKKPQSGPWSFISPAERETLLELLKAKCHSEQTLARQHYWTRVPTPADIERTRKCNDCGVTKGNPDPDVIGAPSSICRFHPAKTAFEKGILYGRGTGGQKARCFNCQQSRKHNGCIRRPAHDFREADGKLAQLEPSPAVNPKARQAVVLDCEMVGVLGPRNGEVSEVVRLAAVDFLSGEVLINTFVEPGVEQCVKSWRTRVSGVSRSLLDEMKKRGQTVQGWRAARGLLWGVVNEQTILIGHSLHHDLAVLRMVHARVVDSAILTRDAVAGGKAGCTRLWALKTLARTFLGLEIQTGKDGHDCLEDTFAARDVVLWCLANPTELGKWAAGEREIVELKKNKQT